MSWINTSNRDKHLIGIFALSLIGTALMGIGCILGLELKDCQQDKKNTSKPISQWNWRRWDWLDCLAGAIGCILATAIHAIIILIIIKI